MAAWDHSLCRSRQALAGPLIDLLEDTEYLENFEEDDVDELCKICNDTFSNCNFNIQKIELPRDGCSPK